MHGMAEVGVGLCKPWFEGSSAPADFCSLHTAAKVMLRRTQIEPGLGVVGRQLQGLLQQGGGGFDSVGSQFQGSQVAVVRGTGIALADRLPVKLGAAAKFRARICCSASCSSTGVGCVAPAEAGCIPGMLIALQLNSESTTRTGINIRVTAAAAISAVAVNIAPSTD